MKAVYQYPLLPQNDPQEVKMPVGAVPLHAGWQGHVLTVWALVDTDAEQRSFVFAIVGTGSQAPPDGHYLGTVFDESFVWHVFWTEAP